MKVIRKSNASHKSYAIATKKITKNSTSGCNQRDLCMVKHG